MNDHVFNIDERTKAVAALLRADTTEREVTSKLYEGKPTYGPGNGLEGKDNILYILMNNYGVALNGKLAHAYERDFYFQQDMLELITRDKAYRMGSMEAFQRLGTISWGEPR
ncbi:hypothetical protein [Sphingomonas sp.]|jgi:hypothetical protein|uniref:hypothetical protein n=1 Tax=Sphingomonas sp. TaxID=28214 RepID=UPI000DBC0D48|nr:hypothetical protein [Sphingomonas sp.]PZT94145.1 MAG: hypothetical protein DI625_08395 [Sphingomonas sp.]